MTYYSIGWYSSIILLVPALIFTLYAQSKVKSTYYKYSQVAGRKRITGAQAARKMLDANGLHHVNIMMCSGELTDHYHPGNQTVNLSTGVYNGTSIASIGVACHECGHAVQHSRNYAPLGIRNAIVPVTNFASKLAIPLFIIGLILGFAGLEIIGILFYGLAVLFQAITLPVEFNASKRALQQMTDVGIVYEDEVDGAKKVLSAAALTYVAALFTSLMQLFRLILIARSRNN